MKAVGLIVFTGFISRIFGFLRELVLANYYGAGSAMDAFNIANNIPGILLAGLGMAITTTFIPAFTNKVNRSGIAGALELSRKVFTAFALIGIAVSGLGILFALPLTHLLAPKFGTEELRLAANLTRVLLITGVFTILSGLCVGFLQARENFIIPSLIAFPSNIVIMGSVILWNRAYGIYALAIGTALAFVAMALFQVPSIIRSGFNFRLSLDLRDSDLRQFSWLVLPVFAGSMLLQINTIVDRIFASGLPVGSISALSYANKINNLIVTLVAAAIATVALPALSQAAAEKDLPRLRSMMLYAVRGINVLVIPMTVGMVILRVPLVHLFFERGAFDARATGMTSIALLYLSLGLFAYGLREIFSRVFYSLQDTVTPMVNSGITIAVNIGLIIILVPRFGLAGLAFATSISGVFSGIQLLGRLRHRIGSVHGLAIMISFLKITLASLAMGAAVYWIYPLIRRFVSGPGFLQQLIAVTAVTIVGVLIYMAGLFLLRAEEIEIIKGILYRRVRRNGLC